MLDLPLNIDYTGKTVVITGAGGVLCAEMVKAFAQSGARVAALDLNEDAVRRLADELKNEGLECTGYKANVLDAEALEEVHKSVLAKYGPCDILINGAGGNNPKATTDNEYQHEARPGQKTFFELDVAGVDFVFRLNFQGSLIPAQVFAKDMVERRSGNILNISSMNAYTPLTKIPAYSGAKAAISNFTQWLATYFARSGIRCNAIAPGLINTESEVADYDDEFMQMELDKILVRRIGEASEVAHLVKFLISDEASYINNSIIRIDGGQYSSN